MSDVFKKLKLHEPQFQPFENLTSAKEFQIEQENQFDYLLTIQTRKIRTKKVLEDVSWSHFLFIFFALKKKIFQSFHAKFLSLLYMISLAYISHCLSRHHNPDHNPELWCVICTGVTLLARLSANQNRVIFSCVLSGAETLVCG